MSVPVRDRADACPGVFAPHDAADGALARIRLPGGAIDAAALRVVAGCAAELGDGRVHLTSRGNLQLRGLDRSDPALAVRLTAAGLLPSPAHERVRNLLASPLSGVAGGLVDVRPLARDLDLGLCARPALAALPGRFLFALDDGRGDVAAEAPDVCWRATAAGTGTLLVAGGHTGLEVDVDAAVATLLAAAAVFLELCAAAGGTAWRARELPDAGARIGAALCGASGDALAGPSDPAAAARPGARTGHPGAGVEPGRRPQPCPPLPGPLVRDDGGIALVVAPLLGALTADQLLLLSDIAPRAVVTPWRTVLFPDPPQDHRLRCLGVTSDACAPQTPIMATPEGATPAGRHPDHPAPPTAAERLAAAGLVVDPDSPVPAVSACAGRPGCAKSRADVRADAVDALRGGRIPAGQRVHVAGCERRCGAPQGPHLDVVALAEGHYSVPGFAP